MKQFECRIEDPNGMHARPAGALAAFAKQLSSDISVTCKGKSVDAKRLLSLMSLGALCGDTLRFEITGDEEERECDRLADFLREQQAPFSGGKAGPSVNE